MTYQEAISYIHSVSWKGSRPGLSRISELCEKLGHPEASLKCVHVAGTNGKGSVCRMLAGILTAAGYRTGLFTSPFIERFNERMMVDCVPVSDDDLARDTAYVKQFADTMTDQPTEFELITAIGFVYFQRMKCDVVVLECGMGGRLDSTNVIQDPLLSIITGIDFDHMAYLGNTIQAIAAEKAGIIKENRPSLYGGGDDSACRTLTTIAAARHSPFHTVDKSRLRVRKMTVSGTVMDFGELTDVCLPLLGSYQPGNAATVLTAAEILRGEGLDLPDSALREGIASARWKARFELLGTDPTVIYDGGHNPQGVAAAVKSIRTYFPGEQVNLLSGVMADKDYDGMIEALKPVTASAYTVTPDNPRSLPAADYAAHFLSHKVPAKAFLSIQDALREAMRESREQNRPLICLGSLYLYADLAAAYRALTGSL